MLFQPWTNPSLSNQPQTANNEDSDELEQNIREDEKGDFLALDDDELIFSEES